MQDETLGGLAAGVTVEVLGFVRRSERGQTERLGFTALEERAAVAARQKTSLSGELTNGVVVAAVATHALVEDADAESLLLQIVKRLADFELGRFGNLARIAALTSSFRAPTAFWRATLPEA